LEEKSIISGLMVDERHRLKVNAVEISDLKTALKNRMERVVAHESTLGTDRKKG